MAAGNSCSGVTIRHQDRQRLQYRGLNESILFPRGACSGWGQSHMCYESLRDRTYFTRMKISRGSMYWTLVGVLSVAIAPMVWLSVTVTL